MPLILSIAMSISLLFTARVDFLNNMYYCSLEFNLRRKFEVIIKGGIIHEEFAKST